MNNKQQSAQFKTRHNQRRPDAWGQPYRYIAIQLRRVVGQMLSLSSDALSAPRVLDYGAADSPYRELLPKASEWVAADLGGNPQAQMQLNGDGSVPTGASEFDLVLSTQVLEHVADPALYLNECYRVLKPGGRLVLSTHGIMVWHPDPHDFWRWTSEGLKAAVERAGFELVAFRGAMGLASCGLQLFQDATHGRIWRRLRRPYAMFMQWLVGFADAYIDRERRNLNALVFVLCAAKPLAEQAQQQEHQ
ncbi:type 11 methyltransferase [Oceanococcus atlanticus]|uniref:Type 11 methyltransferase n=1 Tax=Oceanococcus atlanticus TaxID=1317117 RepID=A0A1Y1SIX2_9GAMM|nr:methyltransferase domain-containing protein [Oceanococcus atlanticus]ORE89149.1 type 11 methyltransferase [Oceanococcus atlanticus]